MKIYSGNNPAKQWMLEEIERLAAGQSIRVFDLGCGAGSVWPRFLQDHPEIVYVGIDTDEWSYINSLENAERNDLAGDIYFLHGSLEAVTGPFDVILSNLTKNDNTRLMDRFPALLSPFGRLALSGFYTGDCDDITRAAAQHSFVVVDAAHEDEWSALLLQRSRA